MRKLTYIFTALITLILNAQQEPKLWSSNPKALIGATIKINAKDANDRLGDSKFYISSPSDVRQRYFNGKKKGAFSSFQADASSLRNKEFKILDVIIKESKLGRLNSIGDEIYYKVSHPTLKQFFISTYSKAKGEFMVIDGVELPPKNEIYCSDFNTDYDKFEKTSTIYTGGINNAIRFFKVKKENEESYIDLYLRAYTTEPIVNKKGVKLIFDDGSLIELPNVDIDIEVSDRFNIGGYDLTAWISINKELHDKFYNNVLTDFRLYIVDVTDINAKDLKEQYRCLIDETYIIN